MSLGSGRRPPRHLTAGSPVSRCPGLRSYRCGQRLKPHGAVAPAATVSPVTKPEMVVAKAPLALLLPLLRLLLLRLVARRCGLAALALR